MLLKPEASGAVKAYMDRIGQTGRTRENVLGKSPKPPLYLHKLLISRLGAGNENRTRIASLEGWSFTIKLCPRKIGRGKMLPWSWQIASRFLKKEFRRAGV